MWLLRSKHRAGRRQSRDPLACCRPARTATRIPDDRSKIEDAATPSGVVDPSRWPDRGPRPARARGEGAMTMRSPSMDGGGHGRRRYPRDLAAFAFGLASCLAVAV